MVDWKTPPARRPPRRRARLRARRSGLRRAAKRGLCPACWRREHGRDASRGRGCQARATPESHQKLEGPLEISVDFHGEDPQRIAAVLKIAGAKAVRTK